MPKASPTQRPIERSPLRVLVGGRRGRMARAVARLVAGADDLVLVGHAGRDEADVDVPPADVLIEFTLPAAIERWARLCTERRMAWVTGTTGLDEATQRLVEDAARSVPVVQAANMSTGATLLAELTARLARVLPQADIEIVETHHRFKRDAPSGTALALARAASGAREVALGEVLRLGRAGHTGARPPGEIAVHALRGGDVVGEHAVVFFLDGERIEVRHSASDRSIFARGALRAARWVVDQSPGLYSMADVLR